ncbi:MAG TPA: hypothetical protein VMU70_01030 [Candidatus Tyrphobacter sp.]|nr:hypothetical protein [Candidatus Tyrphobacter sp.]
MYKDALLKSLPQNIRDWIGSEEITEAISSVNSAMGLSGGQETVLPRLIFSLVTKQISGNDFSDQLKTNLDISPSNKQRLLMLVERDIFSPMEKELVDAGVNLNLTPATPPPATTTQSPSQQIITPITEVEAVKTPQAQAQDSPIMRPAFKNTPFVIHEADVPQVAEEKRPEAENEYFYHPSFDSAPKFEAPAPVAQIETALDDSSSARPISPTPAQAGAPPSRVVHYSELRTPVDPFGRAVPLSPIHPQNVLNLKPAAMPEEKPSVHPDNVVNLKDLPVEEQSQNPNLKSQDDN